MSVLVAIRNESRLKRLYRGDRFKALAERVCREEGLRKDAEVSVLLCDDAAMAQLNESYRGVPGPTDVLSFEQEDTEIAGLARMLGDIVISLETVEQHCQGHRPSMREEVMLLFCHGLLHLLGYDHHSAKAKTRMAKKQAHYLGVSEDAAWHFGVRPLPN